MARIKYYDTLEGWNERGYKITKGSKSERKDRNGVALFSWGQVNPSHYRDASYYDDDLVDDDMRLDDVD